jgi:hypothetical protein
MTSFLKDLEDQLRTAAHQRTSGGHAPAEPPQPDPPRRGRGPRRWLAGGARALPVAIAVAVTVAVLVGALVLLGHRGGQSPTSPASGGPGDAFARLILNTPKARLRRELELMATATRKVQGNSACRIAQPRTVAQIHRAPGQQLLSTLGVLRRPPSAADRLPAGSMSGMGPGVAAYAGAARRAATIGGTSYYIVPIRQDPASDLPSSECLALERAALDKALPTFPESLRSPIRQLSATVIAYEASLAAKAPNDAVCEVTVQHNGGGISCGESVDQIRRGLFPDDDNGTSSGLVPDGVASVTLSFPAAAGRTARSVSATVHGNVYAAATGISGPLKPGSPTIVWHASDGHVLRTYSVDSPASLRALCREHPDTCIGAVLVEGSTGQRSASSSSSSASATATTQSHRSPRPKTSGG